MTEQKHRELIGLSIRRHRRDMDMTQTELARRIGIPSKSAGMICDIEKGRKSINSYLLFRVEQEIGQVWISGDN